jgi:hypothetical protein
MPLPAMQSMAAIKAGVRLYAFALTENPVMEGVLRNRKAEFELSLMNGKM